MRPLTTLDRAIQWALAILCLSPLALAFTVGRPEEPLTSRAEVIAALGRSGAVGLLATLVALFIGLPAGWMLSGFRRSAWPLALCALPLALPPSVAVTGWLRLLAPDGVLSAFTAATDGVFSMGPFFSIPGVAVVLGLGLWPIVAFEAWPGFVRVRGEGYAAALLSGSRLRAFTRIAIPMARGEIASGALLVFLLAASDFTVSSLLLVKTLPVVIDDQWATDRPDAAAWMSLPLLALVLLAALLLSRWKQVGSEQESRGSVTWGPSRIGRAVAVLGIQFGFLIPMLGCAVGAFGTRMPLSPAVREGWPFLAVSLRMAAGVALLAVLVGAVRVVVWPRTAASALCASGLLLLALPGSFVAAGLFAVQVLAREGGLPGLSAGSVVLSLGYLLRFIYLPLRLAEEGLRGMDPAMLESAELSGHGRYSQGLSIALPTVWPHLLAAGMLVFVFVLGEVPLSQRLAPPGQTPVCLWLFNLQHYGYTERVFVLCLMLGSVVWVGLLGTAGWMFRRKREASSA